MVALILIAAVAAAPVAKAKELYDSGLAHYNLGEYDAALADFKESYRLSRAGALLFNLAQTYRLKGDCAEAVRAYRAYLREVPKATNRPMVDGFLAQLEPCPTAPPPPAPSPAEEPPPPAAPVVEPPAPALVPQPAPAAAPAVAAAAEPPPAPSRRGQRIAGIAVIAAGVVALAAGSFFAWQASEVSGQVTRRFTQPGTWDESAQQLEADGVRARTLSIALLAGGGAAAVAGGLVLVF